ncbi:bifunctional nicotinamidase/pyrazinamidase [Methylobacterium sp. J-076]|uniref:bifunctional nicotinamidase/pyrazinamidase n=1 Tax=Methylobacterium sp. J-076 TaxID=2836655 RepID=UPI001FBB718F|nr:bifunctional nicotinamidase/pyrazinamidase [Methylobacterium sp. J-076]MCJ2013879.1 bifunctional nicotinamidase/pyrazinamidase [Methylobacterium sp. J-076]
MIPGPADLLLVIDVQVDFLPGGALPVPDGDRVVRPINALQDRFRHVVLTQDWHPPGHVSFAASHPGRAPFETVRLASGDQTLWPVHCVQGTPGAAFAPGLATDRAALILRKGSDPAVDSYSAFLDANRTTRTGLAAALGERGIRRVVLCGLATDFCVLWSALDARAAGFEVVVVEDAVAGIDAPTVPGGSLAEAWARMAAAGVGRIGAAAFG